MELHRALTQFRSNKSRGYSPADLRIIAEVASALKVGDEFIIRKDYVTDANDVIHIHPTMLVAKKSFPGSTDRGPKPYELWPHFRKLSGWSEK